MTHAEKRLYLSEAEGHHLDGSPRYPSRFLLDIDPSLLAFTEEPKASLIEASRRHIEIITKYMPEDMSDIMFSIGQRVRHPVFGVGTIQNVDKDGGAHIIQFDDMNTARAISFKAKLEKI